MLRGLKNTLKEYCQSAFIALVAALFIKAFLFQTFLIPSESMASTLLVGDRLVAGTSSYGVRLPFTDTTLVRLGDPARGDVVIFSFPPDPSGEFLIKRVVGLPGDRLEIKNDTVIVNGTPLHEPYVTLDPDVTDSLRSFGPVTVPQGEYFVMGDNRDHSYDSRYWGFVPRHMVRAKAWMIYWSSVDFADFRPERVGTRLN